MSELQAVAAAARRLRAEGQPFLVATVVGVRGSSYRRPGARLLLAGDRWITGSVSGGCQCPPVAVQGGTEAALRALNRAQIPADSHRQVLTGGLRGDHQPGERSLGLAELALQPVRLREIPVGGESQHDLIGSQLGQHLPRERGLSGDRHQARHNGYGDDGLAGIDDGLDARRRNEPPGRTAIAVHRNGANEW